MQLAASFAWVFKVEPLVIDRKREHRSKVCGVSVSKQLPTCGFSTTLSNDKGTHYFVITQYKSRERLRPEATEVLKAIVGLE